MRKSLMDGLIQKLYGCALSGIKALRETWGTEREKTYLVIYKQISWWSRGWLSTNVYFH